ncbi:hypothetical protein ABPG77_001126 [Micractinium sp. CCAP 211/92]
MGCAQSTERRRVDQGKVGQKSSVEASSDAGSSGATPVAEPHCYKPAELEAARLQALLDCKLLDTPDERRFDSITSLLKDMLQVPIAVVGLIDDDSLWLKSIQGTEVRRCDRLHSFCDASLHAPNPTMMIVPDTMEDARFQRNQFATGPPFVRFYCGAPLVSSDGHILGSLGVMDIKPRIFAPGTLNLMCNFAELVVREMEREQAIKRLHRQVEDSNAAATQAARQFSARALSCFLDSVMLCDTSAANWPVLYTNDRWCQNTGLAEPEWLKSSFWGAFQALDSEARASAETAAQQGRPFSINVTGRDGRRLTLELRPATRDNLSSGVPAIGIPNFVEGLGPEENKALSKLYFAVLRPAGGKQAVQELLAGERPVDVGTPQGSGGPHDHAARGMLSDSSQLTHNSRSTSFSLNSYGLHCPDKLAGIHIGPLLGSGSYGRVYRGTDPEGEIVAVKVVDCWVDPEHADTAAPMLEAPMSKKLHHPNIVGTSDYATLLVEEEEPEDPAECCSPTSNHSDLSADEEWEEQQRKGKRHHQIWMVQEYCDRGTLGDAVDRGWLRTRPKLDAPPNLLAVLLTAQEIASALAYLHDQNILHGDLSPGNVLLCAPQAASERHPRDTRHFRAKVSDFGLSRVLETKEVKTATCGTVTHMPLELIQDQLLTKAADVYSFGVLVYEMLAGHRAWVEQNTTQILYARTVAKQQLRVPNSCPPGLRSLVEACLSDEYTQRPTFSEIQDRLTLLLAQQA